MTTNYTVTLELAARTIDDDGCDDPVHVAAAGRIGDLDGAAEPHLTRKVDEPTVPAEQPG